MVESVAIVLAAGKGTRMRSDLPKVLHTFMGTPLLTHPLRAAQAAGATSVVVVVGHGAADVRRAVDGMGLDAEIDFAVQAEQNGTGDAVSCALPALAALDDEVPVWILSGDVPCLQASTLCALRQTCMESEAGLAFLTFRPSDPASYGRVLRTPDGRVFAIREFKDASASEREIDEVNAGVYCARLGLLRLELPRLGSDNAQGEIYLTDLVAAAVNSAADAAPTAAVGATEVDALEVAGVNTPEQLAELERAALAIAAQDEHDA